jgi:hypothetical protein
MAEDRVAKHPERQVLRRQLRQAGWNVGEQTKSEGQLRVQLWPVPHTGPAEGVEPRWVEGADKTDAMRNAVRELCALLPAPEPAPPGTASEE